MSVTTIIISAAGLAVGLVLGYYLRLVISLGKKGSMELEIKKMMISAKEESQKVLEDAKKKAREKVEGIEKEKVLELEKLSHLTETEAKEELYKIVERKSEEDMLVRMQKLEVASGEKL